MSSTEAAQIIAGDASGLVSAYCFTAAAVLFIYDSIITTGDEIQCFWGRKVTGAAILFWLNKYMALLYMVWDLLDRPTSAENCIITARGVAALEFSMFLVAAVFAGIRVYALRKSLLLSSFTFLLTAVPFGVNMLDFHYGETGQYSVFGCAPNNRIPSSLEKKLTILCRVCAIAGDCLAVAATWLALSQRHRIHHGFAPKGTLSRVLLVDGTIYFAFLLIINALHLIFTMLQVDEGYLQGNSDFGQFTTPLTALLVSRFLLHLQKASLRAVGMASSQALTSEDSSVIFERVVGSMGASIAPDEYLWQEDAEDGDDPVNQGNNGGSAAME
ncbi:hypothetical protein BD311DRAFT_747179 [Dichomitus squalens]|uniref:DUF6533 domain-containing protein n=1 Tax=Dichomitus squalens TaxID=114155 RepID=A0A4Q9N0Z2_9APHY|nr:hypothetical protein BD311DRAFT_747179 [Dichomitus squalens]